MVALAESDVSLKDFLLGERPDRSAGALSNIIEEDLPEIILSLELPPPPTQSDLLIARCIHEGRGSFRADRFSEVLSRVDNEPYVEELRRVQKRYFAYDGAGGTTYEMQRVVGTSRVPDPQPRARSRQTSTQENVKIEKTANPVSLVVPSPITRITQAVLEEKTEETKPPPISGADMEFEVFEPTSRVGGSSTSTLIAEPQRGTSQEIRIELDTIIGSDCRGAWVQLIDGKIDSIFKVRPTRKSAFGKLIQIPGSLVYKRLEYSDLLNRFAQLSLSTERPSTEENSEIELLNGLLDSVDLEKRWERLNERRQYLILRKHTTGLGPQEDREYHALQDLAERRIDRFMAPQIDRLAEIESFIKQAGLDS